MPLNLSSPHRVGPSYTEMLEMDLDRVHDILDELGAPETRLTLCASDRLGVLAPRLKADTEA